MYLNLVVVQGVLFFSSQQKIEQLSDSDNKLQTVLWYLSVIDAVIVKDRDGIFEMVHPMTLHFLCPSLVPALTKSSYTGHDMLT